jgi:hypothetical protein
VIVHDVGTNTAGSSPVDDSGTEVCTGIVIDGPTDAAAALDVTADVASGVAGTLADADPAGEAADEGEADGEGEGEADGEGEATGVASRMPACLPTKNAPTQIPITQANPMTDSVLLLAGVIELT